MPLARKSLPPSDRGRSHERNQPTRTDAHRRRTDGAPREPTVFERLTARLFDAMKGSADYYIDLHCASMLSIPFSIRDRVLYRLGIRIAGGAGATCCVDGGSVFPTRFDSVSRSVRSFGA